MRYVSTRGRAPALDFAEVTLAGLAGDGGLYVPEAWPALRPETLDRLAGAPYAEIAFEVMRPYLGGAVADGDFRAMIEAAYARFDHPQVAPLAPLDENTWLMELFHGPTLAFKDIALQLLGELFEHLLARQGRRLTVVGATSGDTGSAAIEACRGRAALELFMLHPEGRVSEVQRRQMTTVPDRNVHNIAIEGTFDDCQALVKAMFNDAPFRAALDLGAVNSINWARVMAQTVYYVVASLALRPRGAAPAFAVPTGNFGDVYAGYCARAMGAPVGRLIVASNRNDILYRFFQSGEYRVADVVPTMSVSMDIQLSSNFERLLYDVMGRDGARVAAAMAELAARGAVRVSPAALERARAAFAAGRADEDETLEAMRAVHEEFGRLIDPHTAVGVHAARAAAPEGAPVVVLATAHPSKFPDAVARATGVRPGLPPLLADLLAREERYSVLPNDLRIVQDHIRERARA